MFIEIQVSQSSLTAVNFQTVISISKDVSGFAILKMIDGSDIKTTNKYDNLKRHLNTLGFFK